MKLRISNSEYCKFLQFEYGAHKRQVYNNMNVNLQKIARCTPCDTFISKCFQLEYNLNRLIDN